MPTQMECDLGEFICDKNPYTQSMQLPPNWQAMSEDDPNYNWWYFEGTPRRVALAWRIPYTYLKDGETVTEHLLIGYEGAGP